MLLRSDARVERAEAAKAPPTASMATKLMSLIGAGETADLVCAMGSTADKQVVGLRIFPLTVLTFNVSPHVGGAQQQPVSCAISVENTLDQRVYFRFKTNKPNRYSLEPPEGILRPRSVATVWAVVDPEYVKHLLSTGHAGVLRSEDAVLMTLARLTDRFCQLYDALPSPHDKSIVVSALGQRMRTVRADGQVAAWQKWLCTYVISTLQPPLLVAADHFSGGGGGGVNGATPSRVVSPPGSRADTSPSRSNSVDHAAFQCADANIAEPAVARHPSFGQRVIGTLRSAIESKRQRLSQRDDGSRSPPMDFVRLVARREVVDCAICKMAHGVL